MESEADVIDLDGAYEVWRKMTGQSMDHLDDLEALVEEFGDKWSFDYEDEPTRANPNRVKWTASLWTDFSKRVEARTGNELAEKLRKKKPGR